MERAVIYARYSSDNQRDASIDQQVKACERFATERDLEIIHVYTDRAMTGKTDKRPSFLQMIRDSAKRRFQFVIVYSLDRFSRNKYDSAIHKHTLKENGVRVLSAMEHISDDPTGQLMESILEGFAQYYSDELSQKINRGLTDNAEKGIVNGSLPLGYRRGADGRPEIIPEQAEIVREIFRRVGDGELFIRIVDDLNRRGIPTKTGRAWNKSSFNSILSNERYIGVYRYKNIVHPNGFPPILDRATFQDVQNQLRERPHGRGTTMRRKTEYGTYLLTGKLICGKCGALMTGMSGIGRHGGRCFYYACIRKKNEKACDKKNLRRDSVELAVTSALSQMLMDDDLISWMADQTVAYQMAGTDSSEYENTARRLKETSAKVENILRAIEDGVYTASTKQRLEELEDEKRQLSADLAVMDRDRENIITRDMILSYLEGILDGDIQDKDFQRHMIDSFLYQAISYDDHIRLIYNLTKEPCAVDLPFDTDPTDPSPADGPSSSSPTTEEGSFKLCTSPLYHLKRTPVYFIRGLFIADFPYAG